MRYTKYVVMRLSSCVAAAATAAVALTLLLLGFLPCVQYVHQPRLCVCNGVGNAYKIQHTRYIHFTLHYIKRQKRKSRERRDNEFSSSHSLLHTHTNNAKYILSYSLHFFYPVSFAMLTIAADACETM